MHRPLAGGLTQLGIGEFLEPFCQFLERLYHAVNGFRPKAGPLGIDRVVPTDRDTPAHQRFGMATREHVVNATANEKGSRSDRFRHKLGSDILMEHIGILADFFL